MYKIPDEIIKIIEKTMETWRVELAARGKSLADPERYIPRRCAIAITICNSYEATESRSQEMLSRKKLGKSLEKINYLMYMDDIKQFAKNEKELDTLIQQWEYTVRT